MPAGRSAFKPFTRADSLDRGPAQYLMQVAEPLSRSALRGLIQYDDGIVWNNLMEEFYVEKGDLKGQSSEDKVLVLAQAAKGHRHKYPEHSLDAVLAAKTGSRREVWGAV